MPQLSRSCNKLLRTVRDDAHATLDDHEVEGTSPPSGQPQTAQRRSKRNFSRAISVPEDALTEKSPRKRNPRKRTFESRKELQQPTPPSSREKGKGLALKKKKKSVDGDADLLRDPVSDSGSDSGRSGKKGGKVFKKPASLGSGAGSAGESDALDSDHEPSWLANPVSSGQRMNGSQTGFTNLHAPPTSSAKARMTYSKKATSAKTNEKAKRLKEPKHKAAPKEDVLPARSFLPARNWDQHGGDNDGEASRNFATARGSDGEGTDDGLLHSDSLSILGSLSGSPAADREIQNFDAQLHDEQISSISCAICGEEVDVLLKQNFEDEFNRGRPMNYKWQQRFCRHHKQHRAREVWQERHYPDINWDQLDKRLRKHNKYLLKILTGKTASRHRDALHEKVRSGKKTTMQEFNADGQRRTTAGYYGPRGEKVMTDHILTHLSGEIRKQAAKDKLVAASGVSGGVSGFVQLVLVPELAERLIRDDMEVNEERVKQIMEESAELGELLYPELDEKVVEEVLIVDDD